MKEGAWLELCAYTSAVWGRELTYAQKAAGFKLLSSLSDEAVGGAITAIAEDGVDRLPAWPLVLKTARALEERIREHQPQLPASDSLSDVEHRGVMLQLEARLTPEQRRRAARMREDAVRSVPMKRRLLMLGDLIGKIREGDVDPGSWDRLFEQRLAEERLAGGVLPL